MPRLTTKDLQSMGVKIEAPAQKQTGGRASAAFVAQRGQNDQMNKLEAAYAAILDGGVARGEVRWWAFQIATFKLAHDCRYTPDFLVQYASGELVIEEIKASDGKGGYRCEDDAKVKIKTSAALLPHRVAVIHPCHQNKGQWVRVEIPRA